VYPFPPEVFPHIGGRGGGRLEINVSHTLTVDGFLTSKGGDWKSYRAGGGSGGSVFIKTWTIDGDGTLDTSGTTLVVIGTDFTGICKYNYHTITTTMTIVNKSKSRTEQIVKLVFLLIMSTYTYQQRNHTHSTEPHDHHHSDLQQVGGFLRVLWFPPLIKLTATIQLKYFGKWH
jgi:hypothetical protein